MSAVAGRRRGTGGRPARRAAVVAASVAVIAAASLPGWAYPRPGQVERVSVAPGGVEAEGESFMAEPTPDGRFVAFQSDAPNLVPGDTNDRADIFVRDMATGDVERVSVSSAEEQSDAGSGYPSISADGRFVAFSSFATNLVPGGTSIARPDIFVRDRQAGTTERISVSSTGIESDAPSWEPAISADGRYVAFESWATNLVAGDTNASYDVFVRDRQAGTTERVSVGSDGSEGNSSSQYPDISADGRFVVFQSRSRTLVLGDANNADDIFLHDRVARTTERVSLAPGGLDSNQPSYNPVISADGRVVAFESWGFNLVPGDLNRAPDVFVHDRLSRDTVRVSLSSAGAEGSVNGHSVRPAISADGRHVAFHSAASGLVPGDTNATWDVFLHDVQTATTERVSLSASGAEGTGASRYPAMNADASEVLFESLSPNLVPGKTGSGSDVFVRRRGPATGVGGVATRREDGRVTVSGWAGFSGATVASAADPADVALGPAGADIVGASVVHRPEEEDLLLRLRLSSMPGIVAGGPPGLVYRWAFRVSGASYEVRALRLAATGEPSPDAFVGLYRCDPACVAVTLLAGSVGTAGPEVRASVPLAAVGLGGADSVTAVRASTGPGEAAPGIVTVLDEVSVPDATVAAPTVEVAVAPAGAPEDEVAFTVRAEVLDGRYTATVDESTLPDGALRAWARACHAGACGVASTTVPVA